MLLEQIFDTDIHSCKYYLGKSPRLQEVKLAQSLSKELCGSLCRANDKSLELQNPYCLLHNEKLNN